MEQPLTQKNKDVINLLTIAVSSYLAVCCFDDMSYNGKETLIKLDVKRQANIANNAMGRIVDIIQKDLSFEGADWQNQSVQDYMDVFQIMLLGGDEKRTKIKNYIKTQL